MLYKYGYINRTSKRAITLNRSINGYNKYLIRLFYSITCIYYIKRKVYNKVIYILYK
jgi:hypothetical protein